MHITIIMHLVLQEDFLQPEFIDIVHYCKSPNATPEGLMDMITEESM